MPDYENYSIGQASPVVAWRKGPDRIDYVRQPIVHGELLVSDQDNYAIVFDCQMICPANLRSIVCASDSGLGDREPLICLVAAITSIQISVIANIDYWSEFGEDLDRLFKASKIQVWKGGTLSINKWTPT